MPRKLLKSLLPDRQKIRNAPGMRFFGTLLDDPNLFHLNRHSVSMAFFVGIFICFIPLPGHVLAAAAGALLFRCNLPIAVSLVFISNPITLPLIGFADFELGSWMLQVPAHPFDFHLTWDWLTHGFLRIWQPLMLGSVSAGFIAGVISYGVVQIFWRWHVVCRWKQRRLRRQKNNQPQL